MGLAAPSPEGFAFSNLQLLSQIPHPPGAQALAVSRAELLARSLLQQSELFAELEVMFEVCVVSFEVVCT